MHLAVWVCHKSSRKMVNTYAMLDYCIIEELGTTGRKRKLSLKTLTGKKIRKTSNSKWFNSIWYSCGKEKLLNGLRYPKHTQEENTRKERNRHTKED